MNVLDVSSYPGSATLLGCLIRAPLRLIPKSAVVRILRGPLRGKRWVVGSGIHRIWLGSYEPEKMAAATGLARSGTLAIDIGANVGVYTLLFSGAVGEDGRVVAIEPSPRNVTYLRKHLDLNSVGNVTVIHAAAADRPGTVSFDTGDNPSTGRIAPGGALVVRCVTVDEVVAESSGCTSLLKIDVEGAELDVLKGAERTLRLHRPSVLLATHAPSLRRECARFLEALGYELSTIAGSSDPNEWVARPSAPEHSLGMQSREARADWGND